MSTRCSIKFTDGTREQVTALIFRHCDGYPEGEHGVPATLKRFFDAIEAEVPDDTRFGDSTALAARFVAWQMREYAKPGQLFESAHVRVMLEDSGDIEWVYYVHCQPSYHQPRRPPVEWTEAEGY